MQNRPKAAFLCIGDEILSGRTQDSNLAYLGDWLNKRGVDLFHARVVPDVESEIVTAVNQLRKDYSHVFTSGGIGATHDDITAQSIAMAFGVALNMDDRALEILERNYAEKGGLTQARKLMARIPDGASLISGKNIGAPGFTLENVHVMAGVPSIFRAMLNSLAGDFQSGDVWYSYTLEVYCGETQIASQLQATQQQHQQVKIGSYPKHNNELGYYTQFVFRGPDKQAIEAAVNAAEGFLQHSTIDFSKLGYSN